MKNLKRLHPSGASMALSTVLGLALFGASLSSGIAQQNDRFVPPGQFDKLVASASSLELIEAQLTEDGVMSDPVELFRIPFELRPNNKTDLVIQLNGECAAWIGTAEGEVIPPPPEPDGDGDDPPGDDGPSAVTGASVTVWAEVNGETVAGDNGAVVFCNSNGTGEVTINVDDLIDEYEKTRASNGFQWIAFDVGQGAHEIVIMAGLELHTEPLDDDNGDGGNGNGDNGNGDNGDEEHADSAAAIVGNRILVLERTRALSDDGNGDVTEF